MENRGQAAIITESSYKDLEDKFKIKSTPKKSLN